MWLESTILDCATVMIHFLYFALSITDPHTSHLQTTTNKTHNSNSLPHASLPRRGSKRLYLCQETLQILKMMQRLWGFITELSDWAARDGPHQTLTLEG